MNSEKEEKLYKNRNLYLFNTPLEIGIRALVILNTLESECLGIDRLVIYDYLILHTGDVVGGPPSVHPATPHRSGELIVKRKAMLEGLNLMYSKGLIKIHFLETGIEYGTSEISNLFLEHFTSVYLQNLKENAKWVVNNLHVYSERDLNQYVKSNIDRWGGEFINEALIREI
ncbi:TPA: ABC-three component system middle component 2 [Bacillus cereus]|uniref:ABC-three component system middle component 2 n=1 Tax=Bacillus cereus TaxID=1396 RepID=UPI000BF664D9|nr:ABC-three component system middle component 2 [Bacillus cereus]PES69597.1 hypothetical protein CN512_09640 [Bacillus cereus]